MLDNLSQAFYRVSSNYEFTGKTFEIESKLQSNDSSLVEDLVMLSRRLKKSEKSLSVKLVRAAGGCLGIDRR